MNRTLILSLSGLFLFGCAQNESTSVYMAPMDGSVPTDVLDRGGPESSLQDARMIQDMALVDAAPSVDARPPPVELDMSLEMDAALPTVDARLPEDEMDAAVGPDMAVENPPQCPVDAPANLCLFGETSRVLMNDERLQVTPGIRHQNVGTMGPLEQAQLVLGFGCEGLFSPDTAQEALEMTDDGVQSLLIRRVNPTAYFTWYRFYMGDTEVGYIFRQGSLDLVAMVSDQDMHRCIEPMGDRPPMNCGQLSECLDTCEQVDLECRRPCLRASTPDAVEAYITWDECFSDCGPDPACLDRVCADDRAACFGDP